VRFPFKTHPCGLVPAGDVNWLAHMRSKGPCTPGLPCRQASGHCSWPRFRRNHPRVAAPSPLLTEGSAGRPGAAEGEAANWVSNLPVWASVAYGLFVLAYYVLLAAIVLPGGCLTALAATRRWHQHWGATDQEITKPLPGDDLIAESKLDSTHAITIHAPAERIWPWLAQMGYEDRAGSYSYDLFERSIGRNLDQLDPDIPPLAPGGTMPFYPGAPMTVAVAHPPRALALWQVTSRGRRSTRLGPGVTTMWPGAGRSCSSRSMRPGRGCWSACGSATGRRSSGDRPCGCWWSRPLRHGSRQLLGIRQRAETARPLTTRSARLHQRRQGLRLSPKR
jgi:hypothetical protein